MCQYSHWKSFMFCTRIYDLLLLLLVVDVLNQFLAKLHAKSNVNGMILQREKKIICSIKMLIGHFLLMDCLIEWKMVYFSFDLAFTRVTIQLTFHRFHNGFNPNQTISICMHIYDIWMLYILLCSRQFFLIDFRKKRRNTRF